MQAGTIVNFFLSAECMLTWQQTSVLFFSLVKLGITQPKNVSDAPRHCCPMNPAADQLSPSEVVSDS